jgi:hypothetical protein
MSGKGPKVPCPAPSPGRRTSPTHFLREARDGSETRIRTTEAQLAGGPSRWPGDGAAGVGVEERIDREHHQYRSPEGPLRLILTRALHLFPHEVAAARARGGRNARAEVAEVRGPSSSRPRTDPFPQVWTTSCGRPWRGLWTTTGFLWSTRNPRAGSRETLARLLAQALELLPRTSSGRSGMARRRGSVRRKAGLLADRRGGQVMGPPGSESRSHRPEHHRYGRPRGPRDSYSRGPLPISLAAGRARRPSSPARPRVPATSSARACHLEGAKLPLRGEFPQVWSSGCGGPWAGVWRTRRNLWSREISQEQLAKVLARRIAEGIELAHALPPGSAGWLGDEDPHGGSPACWRTAAAAR